MSKVIACVGAASFLAIVIVIGIFISPTPASVKNQRQLVFLLRHARPDSSGGGPSPIQRVILADRLMLLPEHEQTAAGYVLRLHVQSTAFTIEARPLNVPKTGLFSFFRDESGEVRFEPDLGKAASAKSRRWSPTIPEEPR